MFQSTHPHGVRLDYSSKVYGTFVVSIHAPAWGATSSIIHLFGHLFVSIHAPAWGATHLKTLSQLKSVFQSTHPHGVRLSSILSNLTKMSFNPRTRMGCDVRNGKKWAFATSVSIHAPAWGATNLITMKPQAKKFQSTHPHGVRLQTPSELQSWIVSIHAPAWGATLSYSGIGKSSVVSIHAPAWGATCLKSPKRKHRIGFNPRTRMGCDDKIHNDIPSVFVSIHAPAWGATIG